MTTRKPLIPTSSKTQNKPSQPHIYEESVNLRERAKSLHFHSLQSAVEILIMSDNYTNLKYRSSIRKSIDKINEIVGAPEDGWSQDPEIELANPKYTTKLLNLYPRDDLDDDDRFYVIAFLLGCFEEAIHRGIDISGDWDHAARLISRDIDLHANTLAYWSCYEAEDPNDPEQIFVISRQVRSIWDHHREEYL